MDLDSVEAGGAGVARGAGVVPEDAGDVREIERPRGGGLDEAGPVIGPAAEGRAEGPTGAPPPGWSERCEIRPTCQIWATISPPTAWTASVTRRQPSTCASLWRPGVKA